jgi:tRNA nucleotidyltransferase/poly(A) polymerase
LENVSRERIYTEWIKLLSGKGAHRILLEFSDIADYISPGLSNMSLPSEERFAIASPHARMLSLYLWGKEDAASDFSASMLYLRSDKHIRTLGVAVLTQIFDASLSTLPEAQRLLYKIGEEAALLTAELGALIGKWDSGALRLVREALELGLPYRISDVEIGGGELIALGFSGERVGDMLHRLLLAVIDGEVENSKEALLSYAVT